MSPDELETLTDRVFAAADPSLVEELRTAVLEVEALPTDSPARPHAVCDVALLVAFKLGFHRTDLDTSVADLERGYTLWHWRSSCS